MNDVPLDRRSPTEALVWGLLVRWALANGVGLDDAQGIATETLDRVEHMELSYDRNAEVFVFAAKLMAEHDGPSA